MNSDTSPATSTALAFFDGSAVATESAPVIADVSKDQISIYTVRKGDTLSAIAEMFGVSVNTIKWSNDISGALSVGQQLVILPVSGVLHTVKSGDTLVGIALKYKVDVDEVVLYNDIDKNSKLAIGDTIIVPDGQVSVGVPSNTTKTSTPVSKLVANYPDLNGYYLRPIAGGVKTQGIHGFNGVDLAASLNTPIFASASGKVIISKNNGGWNGGYGNYIVLSHSNGTQTLYSHLNESLVAVGETVSRGQTIGLMGNTGKVTGKTGIHLHFEIRGARNPF